MFVFWALVVCWSGESFLGVQGMRTHRNMFSPAFVRSVRIVLRRGGVVVYPTDTAYALGGRFDRARVFRRVLRMKGSARRGNAKFTLVAASLAQVERHFRLSPAARHLARKFWPGPLSIAVNKKYAVRVPDCGVARALARYAGAPLIATSANRSGGKTPYSVAAVRQELRGAAQPDLIVDAGRLPKRKPSTIVKVDGRGRMVVLRQGTVRVDCLR